MATRTARASAALVAARAAHAGTVAAEPIGPRRKLARFVNVYQLDPVQRIALVKRGIPATEVAQIAQSIGQPKERLMRFLGLPRATVDRRARAKQHLSVEHSERVLGFKNLVGQVETIVAQSGDPAGFDAARWLGQWLELPLPALGGRRPAEFMDTSEGQQLVAGVIAKMQSGAYA